MESSRISSMYYFGGLLSGLLRGEFTRVDLHAYPAHLHINVESGWRGCKLGQRLLVARPDRFWAKWFGHPVDNRCYGLKLQG